MIVKFLNAVAVVLISANSMSMASDIGKNVFNVKWGRTPDNVAASLKDDPESWNFNFRPYGTSAEVLWSDPAIQRAVTSGEFAEDSRPTAINVSCDENGFTVLALCVEPSLKSYLHATNNLPISPLEIFFLPGDADDDKIEHHYMFFYSGEKLDEYPWLMPDRTFRPMAPYTMTDETLLENAILVRFTFKWDGLFDRLPFSDKRDNFWRLSVIRWAPDGGQTWGGVVHQQNQAGYIRFPDFTPEQKTQIMKGLLERAWNSFRTTAAGRNLSMNAGNMPFDITSRKWIEEENKAAQRSYVNPNEDPDFRPVLRKLIDERNALAEKIAKFEQLPFSDRLEFYRKASDMLFNFEYDVQAALSVYEESKLFEE